MLNAQKLQETAEDVIHFAALILFLGVVGTGSSQQDVLALVLDNVHSDHQIVEIFAAGLANLVFLRFIIRNVKG